MSKSPPSPELVEAYQLIKQGQRQQAGRLLKTYLNTHPQDTDAWWLMAHAVTKPEHVRRSLEMILKADPNHAKARKKLTKMDEDEFAAAASPAKPAPASAPPIPTPNASFDDYLAESATQDPFTAPVVDNPFADVPEPGNPFGTEKVTVEDDTISTYNFFAKSNQFDPAAAAHLRSDIPPAQAAGTGNQPVWGPGLGFVTEEAPPSVAAKMNVVADDFALLDDVRSAKPSYDAWLGWALAAVAVVVLAGLIVYVVNSVGGDDNVPKMTTLARDNFSVSVPDGWDIQCGYEGLGYQVCGIANHPFYNEIDLYLGNEIDIGDMLTEAFSMAFSGGENLPDDAVSIIIMDVPERSRAYDPGSWAKTKYEWTQSEWDFFDYDVVKYDKQNNPPRVVNNRDAYYYEFIARDSTWGRDIAYDVYIPHDNLMLWMTVSVQGPMRGSDYHAMVQEIIDSILINE